MLRRLPLLTLFVALLTAREAAAQLRPSTVQLPTYSFFTVNTTVVVPDRGTALLGGVGRMSEGAAAFGPPFLPGSRASGREVGAASLRVSAQIHDLKAMDAAILGQAGARRPNLVETARPPRGAGPVAIAELDRQAAAERQAESIDAAGYLAKGRQAAAAGKPGVAKIYLQMAARRADESLRSQIESELARLAGPK